MKKYLYLLVMFLLLTNYNYGQSEQDSFAAYHKVNKWAVVKLTIAYMEDLRNWTPETKRSKVKSSLIKEFDDYIISVKKYDKYSEVVDLDGFDMLLKNAWDGTRKVVFQKYKHELVDDIIVYNFDDIPFVPEKVSNNRRLETIATLNDKFNSLLPKLEKQNEIVEDKKEITNSISKPNNSSRKSDNKSIFVYVKQYAPLIISILIILFFGFKLKKVKQELKNLKEDKNRQSKGLEDDRNKVSQNDLIISENTIKSLKDQKESLQKENSDLKQQLHSIKKDVDVGNLEKPREDVKSEPIDLTVPKVNQTSTKFIYFPSPFEEFKFANEEVSETEKQNSLYVAEIEKNTNRGTISLLETADLSRALNSPNTFLETVCNYENAYSSSAKAIKVIEDGKVALIGNDWVVSSKIKIKFI